MIIAGGTYREQCFFPHWDRIFGSGLRAALAVSYLSPNTVLHTYVHDEWREDVEATLVAFGIRSEITRVQDQITFRYLHPFEKMGWAPTNPAKGPEIEVEGHVVLRFGMLDGNARVIGDRVVYDPQSDKPESFFANGSKAKQLAMVLSQLELLRLGLPDKWSADMDPYSAKHEEIHAAVQNIYDAEPNGQLLLVVKHRLGGATVYIGDDTPIEIPAYTSDAYFRIGAGDVFSAAFAYAWGERNMSPQEAADLASRYLAYFVENHRLPLLTQAELGSGSPISGQFGHIALSGSQQTLDNCALLQQTRLWLGYFGATCDPSLTWDRTATLEAPPPRALLGLVDHPTTARHCVEHLRRRSAGRPIILYWPNAKTLDTARLDDSIWVSDDYVSALYLALRESSQ